jgi:menaquinol-cytochrome c reductase iron-sulfur subunit
VASEPPWGIPDKPQQAGEETPPELEFPGRRSFITVLMAVGGAVVGAALAVPLLRFAFYPVFAQTTQTSWSSLGPLGSFQSLAAPMRMIVKVTQVDGWRASASRNVVYVTKGSRQGSIGGMEVLSSICPHLGCEVAWNAAQGRFFCPCHGSVFAADGARISGPAPRGMDTLPIKTQGGDLQVRYEYFRQLVPDKEVMS